MKFTILTLFPEMIGPYFESSILKRAQAKGLIEVELVNIRDYTKDKYGRTDTPPTGGGAGLVMKCQPIIDALKDHSTSDSYKIIMSPRGRTYNQRIAEEFSKNYDHIVILCGHYEGIDERVYKYFDESISLGDYILTGGELGAAIIVDSVSRLIDGVISEESIKEESFTNNTLEYPQFTEPYDFEGDKIPEILYSGNHEIIAKWRRKESFKLMQKNRPDLMEKVELSKQDKKLLEEIKEGNDNPKWLLDTLEKASKFKKNN